jgi:hypothetical protein
MFAAMRLASSFVSNFADRRPLPLAAVKGYLLPKRDGGHGSPCPVLAISTSLKRGTAMKKIATLMALALALTAGMALTTAFAFSLLPLFGPEQQQSLH